MPGVVVILFNHLFNSITMSYKIIDIEGIGEVFAEKLSQAGVTTTEELLEHGKQPWAIGKEIERMVEQAKELPPVVEY